MNQITSYRHKSAGAFLLAFLLINLFTFSFATSAFAQTYTGPLVITKGGTYTGNWESKNTEIPAIEIRTSEPVIIEKSNIRGAGYLIKSWGYSVDVTVRHTNGYGITPTAWTEYKKSRRFLTADVFKNVVVENCYMENTAGIQISERYVGNQTTSQTIKIRYNKIKNIDGRIYGGKDLVNFVGLNFKGAIKYAEIAWNQIINEPNNSLVEDNINMYNTQGTADSPIKIHNNYIQGAFPIPATASDFSGGGIITDGDGDISIAPAHIEAYENILVGLGNYSMGIAGGNNIRYHHNRAVNAAVFADGSKYNMYTSGLWGNDYYKKNTTFNNSIDNNTVGVVAWGWDNNRNDISVAEKVTMSNNTFLASPVSYKNHTDEFNLWNSRLQQKGIVLGPNGTTAPAPTTPTNQLPIVAITAPAANASFTQGTAINITANASDADGSVKKVEFFQGTVKLGEDLTSPFSFAWSNAAAGSYNLTAKATDNAGAVKTSTTVAITVKASTTTPAPTPTDPVAGTGKITREFWANVNTESIAQLPLTQAPTSKSELTLFEAPTDAAENYGQRIRGYITAPTTGSYTFWIAGDNAAELYLSTSEDPTKKVKIASVNGWTNPREWTKYASQKSAAITLTAGKRYYIEALHLEVEGGDNVAVGWTLPGGVQERPIAGTRLSPIGSTAPTPPTYVTGKISREFWANVNTESIAQLPLTQAPTSKSELTLFEAPTDAAENYGQRIRGYVTAPTTGSYTFWIAGDNAAELYLSTSEDPTKKVKIASVNGWTNPREWTKYASQKSVAITLTAGKRYYIEALHLEVEGGDNVAVGWTLPGGAHERPIAGNRLSPMGAATTTSTAAATYTEPVFTQATAYPNPFRDHLTLNMGEQKVTLQEIVMVNQAGTVVFKMTNPELVNNKLEIDLGGLNLQAGLYILKYTDAQGTKSLKVMKE